MFHTQLLVAAKMILSDIFDIMNKVQNVRTMKVRTPYILCKVLEFDVNQILQPPRTV